MQEGRETGLGITCTVTASLAAVRRPLLPSLRPVFYEETFVKHVLGTAPVSGPKHVSGMLCGVLVSRRSKQAEWESPSCASVTYSRAEWVSVPGLPSEPWAI